MRFQTSQKALLELLLLLPQPLVTPPSNEEHKQLWTQQWTPAIFPCSGDSFSTPWHGLCQATGCECPRMQSTPEQSSLGYHTWGRAKGMGVNCSKAQRAPQSSCFKHLHETIHAGGIQLKSSVLSQIARIRGVGLSNHHFGQAHIGQLHQSALVPGYTNFQLDSAYNQFVTSRVSTLSTCLHPLGPKSCNFPLIVQRTSKPWMLLVHLCALLRENQCQSHLCIT